MYPTFIEALERRLEQGLPGRDAQLKMAPPGRLDYTVEEILGQNPRLAAVMLLVFRRQGEWKTLFTRRHDYEGVHSGQISLPGGKREETDPDFRFTALRETREEVGLSESGIRILGALSELYVPPSHFMIYPYIGYAGTDPVFVPDQAEVKELIEVPLSHFSSPGARKMETIRTSKYEIPSVPAFVYQNHLIWGATAIVLSEFSEIFTSLETSNT